MHYYPIDTPCILQIYEGKVDPWVMSDNCTDNVPILIKRATFCSAFAADARDFRQYNSWVRCSHSSHSFMRGPSAFPDCQGWNACMMLPAMQQGCLECLNLWTWARHAVAAVTG